MKLKNLVIAMATMTVLAVASVTSAAQAVVSPVEQSMEIIAVAKAEIPAESELIGYNVKGAISIVTFSDPNTLERYDVEVITATGKVTEIDVKGASFILGSTMIVKTSTEIKNIIMQTYPNARNIVVEVDKEGNNFYYDVEFVTDKFKADVKMDPVTGAFGERELDYF